MPLRTIAESPNSVRIGADNLAIIDVNKPALDIPTYWHKFAIISVHGLKRNAVLKILLEHVRPLEFIPLCYTQSDDGAFFFARMCREAVEKFCSDKLTVSNPYDTAKPFKMNITLRYSSTNTIKVDVTKNLLAVLQKRLKAGALCLGNFSEDSDLTEFFLLSQPKLLAFVLNVAKHLKPTGIKLSNNEIKSLDALQVLAPHNVTSLDLRQNGLTDLAELKHVTGLDVTELWLEGNPLCALYDEYGYVQQVIKYCPKIEKLDGFLLRQNGAPSFRRNFLCDMAAYSVVDQFLAQFFPTYDSKNFIKLEGFYHKNALFSMSAEFFQHQLSSSNAHLKSYKVFSRNLLSDPDGSTNLYIGSSEIMRLFNKLPRCEHDPYSFTVDVLHYVSHCAIVVVTGVFRELLNIERILGFNRYFVLERRDDVYRISNEQIHIFNALTSQQVTAFKNPIVLQEAKSPVQQGQMVNTFAVITNLTKEWAKILLNCIKTDILAINSGYLLNRKIMYIFVLFTLCSNHPNTENLISERSRLELRKIFSLNIHSPAPIMFNPYFESLLRDYFSFGFLEECHYNLKHAMMLFVELYKSNKIPSRGFKNVD